MLAAGGADTKRQDPMSALSQREPRSSVTARCIGRKQQRAKIGNALRVAGGREWTAGAWRIHRGAEALGSVG